MSAHVEVAAIQLAAVPGEAEHNLARLASLARERAAGASLIVAPELAVSGYDLGLIAARPELAETLDGPTTTTAVELAGALDATMVVGLLERDGAELYDSAVVADRNGVVARYRKTHLYPPETAHFAAGHELFVTPTAAGRLGLMICFEHAFPEIATALALQDAQILVIPSAVPTGYEHLMTLRTRARAQDNQQFAVACNLAGGPFCGRSLIAGPDGAVLAEAGTDETVVRAVLDLDTIERERRQEPALELRRPELYAPATAPRDATRQR
jgi:predicted amidohydrolase